MSQLGKLTVNRRDLLALLGTGAGITLAGCLGDDDDGTPAEDDSVTLVIGMDDSHRLIDPIRHMGSQAAAILNQVFDAPYTYDEGVGFSPELAVGDPEIDRDGERWTVEIDEDATFHNGDPVTVDDIRYSYTQPVVEERGDASRYAVIDEVVEVDEHTVQFDLERPFVRFQLVLTDYIVPETVREDNKGAEDEWTENIIGSGPFEFVEWVEGDETVLEATDDYWLGEEPLVDEVIFREVEEPSTRVTTLETGETHLINGVPGDLHQTVDGLSGASLDLEESIEINYMAFNCNEGPTADPQVRAGIDACIDLDFEIEVHVGNMGSRIYADMPPVLTDEWDFPVDEWAEIPHDQDYDHAAQLFEAGGLDPDYELQVLTYDERHREIGTSLVNNIEEAGYSANLQHLEWGTFVAQFNSGSEDDMNVYFLSSAGEPMPNRYMYTRHHSDRFGADNGTYYESQELFDRIEQADETPDEDARRDLIIQIQEEILEQRVHLPMYVTNESWGVSDDVGDFHVHSVPTENPRIRTPYNNVSLD